MRIWSSTTAAVHLLCTRFCSGTTSILITTSMTSAEAERFSSTLKRIKMFLHNAVCQECVNALAVPSMEQELVWKMVDFNERVMDHFASLKDRRAKFQYN